MALIFLEHYLLQILFTVGMIVLTGLTVSGSKHLFLKSCGKGAFCVEQVTGLVGTPIHELSHALFCLIFGHRITAICLWSPNPRDGNLGYVTHSYRKRNLWHQIGNFFIGIAPILGGSAVLLLFLWLLLPDSSEIVFSAVSYFPVDLQELPMALLNHASSVIKTLFDPNNFLRFHWYLYMLLAITVVLHMEISRSDLRSGVWGFSILAVLLLVTDFSLLFVCPEYLHAITDVAVRIGVCLMSFLCLAVLLAFILLIVSALMLIVRRRA